MSATWWSGGKIRSYSGYSIDPANELPGRTAAMYGFAEYTIKNKLKLYERSNVLENYFRAVGHTSVKPITRCHCTRPVRKVRLRPRKRLISSQQGAATMPDIAPKPSACFCKRCKSAAKTLMAASMPPFEKFLEHTMVLKSECEKAGELTPERAAKFDQYKVALLDARGEYEGQIADLICENLTIEEVDSLIAFFNSPACAALQKSQNLAAVVKNIGTVFRTRVMERCPDAWQMLMNDGGTWQAKNSPEGSEVIVADVPPSASGWKKIDLASGSSKQAEELVPGAPVEEAELEKLRGGGDVA